MFDQSKMKSLKGARSRQTCDEVTIIDIPATNSKSIFPVLLLSDLHLDHPHHKEDEFKRLMDQAKKAGAKVLINGDTLCAMQGRNDKRHNKGSVPKELQRNDYWNALVDFAVEKLAPYKDIIAWMGYGNHETAPIKHSEIDPLKMVVQRLNDLGADIKLGAYKSWVVFSVSRNGSRSTNTITIRAYHGSGGGGPVTKAMIAHQRLVAQTEGADVIWTGHVHEYHTSTWVKDDLSPLKSLSKKTIYAVTTPGFKDEHDSGNGWAIERGIGPKPLGGAWLMMYWFPEKSSLTVNSIYHAQ